MARRSSHTVRRILARNVRRLRLAKNWNQEELGDAADLPQAQISQIETEQNNITLDNLEKLAAALGTRPADLLDEVKRS